MIWTLLRTYLASFFICTVYCREHLEVAENPIHFMNALNDDKDTDNRYHAGDNIMTDAYLSTYNCDLAPSVCPAEVKGTHHPTSCEYTSRRDQQINAMNGDTKSDVMCLQGVWYARDLEKIVKEVKEFEYSYSFLHNKNGTFDTSTRFPAPCSEKDKPILEIMGQCEFTSCYYTSERVEIFKCIEDQCKIKNIMKSMSETCLGCIFQGTQADNFHECLEQEYAFNPTGLLFLSKTPIIKFNRSFFHGVENKNNTDKKIYHESAELVQRGYLDVEVFRIGRIVCTHLTGSLGSSYVEISDKFKSYEQKNEYEFKVLFKLMENEDKGIIMGDLNASPSLTKGNLAAQFPKNLAIMRDYGFEDPVSDSYKTRIADCSFCCGNHLVPRGDVGVCSKYSKLNGYIYDHVLVKGYYVHDTAEDFITNNAVARIFLIDEQHRAISRHYGFRVPILV